MEFPANAKKAIAATFYDKKIEILEVEKTLDEEGGAITGEQIVKISFMGNVRFLTLQEQQTELGLTKQADVEISCPTSTDVTVDTLLRYAGQTYIATQVLPRDSHLMILGAKWPTV